jgi:hypothetical protein
MRRNSNGPGSFATERRGMRSPRFRLSWGIRLAALTFLALAAAGGIAYASIPDSSGVIHSCYKTMSGDLRVIDSEAGQNCLASENSLHWNETSALSAHRSAGPTDAPPGPGFMTIVTLHVDPGFYVFAAKTVIAVVGADAGTGSDCIVTYDTGGGELDADRSNQPLPNIGPTPRATHNLQRLLQFGGTSATIRLKCRAGTLWTASNSSIIAIQVQNALDIEVSG